MGAWVWALVVVAGATGQFLDALAGMGFGAISSTVMVAAGISPVMVVATVNLAKVGSGLVSGLSHWRFGNVESRWFLPLLLPSIAGGVLAALLITALSQDVARGLVPVLLLAMGILVLRRFLLRSGGLGTIAGGSQDAAAVAAAPPWWAPRGVSPRTRETMDIGAIGLVAGMLNGMAGVFGPFATSALLLRGGSHPRYAVGTVNLVEFFVAAAVAATLLWRLDLESFSWGLPAALMAGSLLTAPVGAYLARHLPARVVGVAAGLALVGLNGWGIARVLLG